MLSLSYPKALLSCFLFSLMRSENPRKHRSTQRASTAVAEAFSSPRSLSPLRRRPGHGSPNLGNSPEYPKGWLEENKSRSDSDDASEASETSIYSSTMEESSVSEHLNELQQENADLKLTLEALRAENERLKTESKATSRQTRIVLENFEGEFSGHADAADGLAMALLDGDEEAMEKFCDDLEDDACPVEPTVSFREALRDRAVWLIGLLIFQSASGLILAHNEQLLEKHPVIIFFLTMLVGAGGNAGNQSSVRVIRGLALGTLNRQTQAQFLVREFKMAVTLSCLVSLAGFCRAAVFATPLPETLAVVASLFFIVLSSICLGAILPLGLKRIGVDPAHASTSIQVIMDILGVFLAVAMSALILDSPLGAMLLSRLGMK